MSPHQQNRAFEVLLRLRRFKPPPKPIITRSEPPEQIVKRMCNAIGIPVRDVLGKTRAGHVVFARMIIAYHLYEEAGLTATETGKILGKGHSMVFYYLKQYETLKTTKNGEFIKMLNKVKNVEI